VKVDSAGAPVPLHLGILGGASEVRGVELSGAMTLLANEPWRPIVVISALIDDQQCRIASNLFGELDRIGRATRLIVPEVRLDNRGLRTVSDPSAFSTLTSRANTRIVSIGVPERPGDDWADPEAPASDLDAIDRYIARRATAIINADAGAA